MSISSYLVCHSSRSLLGLGKPLRQPDGTITAFSYSSADSSDALFARALWKFLDACSAADLTLCFSGDPDFDEIMEYREIGGWEEDGGLPFDAYLAGDAVGTTTYYAKLRPGYPRENPSGIVRRRGAEGAGAVDEAFTRNLRWEPTEYLRRHAVGLDDTESVEIDEAEAVAFALGVLTSRFRPRLPLVDPRSVS
jgi:hypothetical protein